MSEEPTKNSRWLLRKTWWTIAVCSLLYVLVNYSDYVWKFSVFSDKTTDKIWAVISDDWRNWWKTLWNWDWITRLESKKKEKDGRWESMKQANIKPSSYEESDIPDTITTIQSTLYNKFSALWTSDEAKELDSKWEWETDSELSSYQKIDTLTSPIDFNSYKTKTRLTAPAYQESLNDFFIRIRQEWWVFSEEPMSCSTEYRDSKTFSTITVFLETSYSKWNNIVRWKLLLPEGKISWGRNIIDVWSNELHFTLYQRKWTCQATFDAELSDDPIYSRKVALSKKNGLLILEIVFWTIMWDQWRS